MEEDSLKDLLERGRLGTFPSVDKLFVPEEPPRVSSDFLEDDATLGRKTMMEMRTDESFRLAPTVPKNDPIPRW